jgi:arylsulfatase A-like enzyme
MPINDTGATGIPPHARGYDGFPGTIGRTVRESTRAWPRERRAPDDAPNIVVVLLDDMGYSDIAPFGSEIPTPNLDRIAGTGLSLTNYHTTPVCSPARAAMMTGLNPHRAGFASVANSDPGYPNMRVEIDEDVATLPEVLRGHGYATFGVGKWHLTRDALMNDGAPKHTWPLQRGFDHYYGTLEGCNSFFHPNRLVRDNTPVDVDALPDGYYLTDDLTDQAVSMIKGLRASDSRKPFFLYFAHHAMHGPLGAKPQDIERFRGQYDDGWDVIRERRHARQIELGIIGPDVPLPPRNAEPGFDVPAWDSLPEEERTLYARYMEVYAAMVHSVDESLGRILDTIEALGELDDTIVVFTSDNGGTAEGGLEGTRSYFSRFVHIPGIPKDWENDVARDLELIGGPRTMVHYPRGWGMASNTPFRFYKGQTFAGGVRVPFLISWPKGFEAGGTRHQYQYVTDVLPSLLDLAGLEHPGERNGAPTKSIDGFSFKPLTRSADAESTHTEQYAEFGGNRGFYRDGWKVVTNHAPGTPFHDGEWELYDVRTDPNELHNLADDEPGLLKELAEAWEEAAWRNTVFPLGASMLPGRRPAEQELARPVRILPGTPKLERYRSSRLTSLRSFAVAIEIEHGEGHDGVLAAHGDQGGGYSVYVEDARLHVAYNEYGRLREIDGGPIAPGAHRIELRVDWQPEFRVDVRLLVDGVEVGELPGVWMLVGMAPFSGIDVGLNRGGPVHWELYERHGSFPYSGLLHHATFTPGEVADYDPAQVLQAEIETAAFYD